MLSVQRHPFFVNNTVYFLKGKTRQSSGPLMLRAQASVFLPLSTSKNFVLRTDL